jgi:phosphatidylglycerophosphate synthase
MAGRPPPREPEGYSYACENKSLVDRYLIGRITPLAIKLLPRGLSANAISLAGSALCALAFLILAGLPFGPLPAFARRNPWIFGVLALLVAAYQLLDNLDGIQARRNGSSSPLGEFIDHWLDSLNAFMLPLGLALAFPAVPPALAAAGVLAFAIADWLSGRSVLETGRVEFGAVGAEEGLSAFILFLLSVWPLGYAAWADPIPGLGLAPVCLVYALVPLSYLFIAARELARCREALPGLGAVALALSPVLAWILLALPRYGSLALLVGGLALGGMGTRLAGEALRERLFGIAKKRIDPTSLIASASLLASLLVPGLPSWAPLAAGFAALAWAASALVAQFAGAVAAARAATGKGLFG